MLLLSAVRRCLVALVVTSTVAQATLNVDSAQRPQLLRAPDDLKLLSDEAFTVLSNAAFPKHSVRVKKSNFCDGTVAYVSRF